MPLLSINLLHISRISHDYEFCGENSMVGDDLFLMCFAPHTTSQPTMHERPPKQHANHDTIFSPMNPLHIFIYSPSIYNHRRYMKL